MCLQRVGRIVVYLCAEEYYPVHHKPREHVHLRNVQLAFFQYVWVEVLVLGVYHVVENHAVYPKVLGCVFSEFVHLKNILYI